MTIANGEDSDRFEEAFINAGAYLTPLCTVSTLYHNADSS